MRNFAISTADVDADYSDNCRPGAGLDRLWVAPEHMRHCAAVRRLCWAEEFREESEGERPALRLATCGEDHLVRVYSILC